MEIDTLETLALPLVVPASESKVDISAINPIDRERLAEWIESVAARLPARIEQAESYLRAGGTTPGLYGQIQYWKAAVGTCRQLAYLLRTSAGGSLGPPVKKKKKG